MSSRRNEIAAVIELLRTDYAIVSLEHAGKIVRYRRLALPFPSLGAAQALYAQAVAACEQIGRRGRGLLVDTREAMGRNDPDFEALLNDFRSRVIVGFAGYVVLVQTAAGRLQAQRINRSQPAQGMVTTSETEAVCALLKLPGAEAPQ